ncbi:MAG: flavin reductase [Calditrichaeota bacterium]|nr:MAG: flavin reductase [Calditrichota bacterium]
MPISPDLFKQVMSQFCTGVTVVTFKNGPTIHGLTVNAFSSVSLDPPLILVCIDKKSSSHAALSESGRFVVNILSEGQAELAARFANPSLSSSERYAGTVYDLNDAGIPVFAHTLGHLVCRTEQQVDGGDHTIFLAQVEHASVLAHGNPLLYFRREFYELGKRG